MYSCVHESMHACMSQQYSATVAAFVPRAEMGACTMRWKAPRRSMPPHTPAGAPGAATGAMHGDYSGAMPALPQLCRLAMYRKFQTYCSWRRMRAD